MARFCYNNGRTEIAPSNIAKLNCNPHFMNMNACDSVTGRRNIPDQTEKSLGGISSCAWSELLIALKQSQDLLPTGNSSFINQRVLDYFVGMLVLNSPSTPYASFSEKSNFLFPSDKGSNRSLRNSCSQTTWWFEDLVFLNTILVEKLIRTMVSQEFDHAIISKFLFYYQKMKFFSATPAEKRGTTEVVISLLCLLDGNSLCLKRLFKIYQAALKVKVSKQYRRMVESLIGSQLDRAMFDFLLVPSARGKNYIYDVNMVLKFVKAFLLEGDCRLTPSRLNKVAKLMDLFLAEVAPDSHLKLSKFSALTMILPDCARESHDRLYQAMDMYFEVHTELCEEEKISVCWTLNYEKLSIEALKHLARNSNFPSRISVKAFMVQNSKLTSLIREIYHHKTTRDPWFSDTAKEIKGVNDDNEQNINNANKFSADLQGRHNWKEVKLMNICRRKQISTSGHARYLPRLCRC